MGCTNGENVVRFPEQDKVKILLMMNKILVALIIRERGAVVDEQSMKLLNVLDEFEDCSECELRLRIDQWKSDLMRQGRYEGVPIAEAVYRVSLLRYR